MSRILKPKKNMTEITFKKDLRGDCPAKILAVAAFIFLASAVNSQAQDNNISGNVKDASTLSPMGNVHLILVQSSKGSSTG